MDDKRGNQQNINITNGKDINIGDLSINSNDKASNPNINKRTESLLRKTVVQLVSEGEVRKGLSLLIEKLDENGIKYNQAVLLLGRLNAIEMEEGSGISFNDAVRKELSSIRKSIVSLVQGLGYTQK